jgi:hypothetical protein
MRNIWHLISFLLLATALSCQKSGAIAPAEKILRLQLDTNGVAAPNYAIPADNYSYSQILAIADSSVVDTTTTIVFTTDNGTFSTGGQSATVKIDLHGMASVFLKSKSVVSAHVQATIAGNYTQNISVTFVTAYPDSLFVNLPDSANDLPETRINFNTILYKHHGSSSPGLNIGYEGFDNNGNSLGYFYDPTPSDTTGNATAQFWLNNSNYVGFIFIKAYIVIATGDSVTATNTMYIVK